MNELPPLPPGFQIDPPVEPPAPPPGFVLDAAPRPIMQNGQTIGEQLPSQPGGPLRIAVDASPEPSLVDQIMAGADYADNTGANFFQGIRKGASNTLGLPVDAINNFPRLWGGDAISPNPVGGSASIDSLLTGFGLVPPAPEPADGVQRIAGRIGQELGAAAVPAVGMVGKFGGVGLEAAQAAPSLARFFGAEAAAVNPAAYLGKEAAFATAAGLGAGLSNEVFGPSVWSDVGGSLAGAGALGIGSAVGKSGMDIGRAFFGNGTFADEVVREAVMRDLAAAANITAKAGDAPDLTPIINAAENGPPTPFGPGTSQPGPRVSEAIPGYQESLADRTKIPGIAALEYSRQSGPNAGIYTAQRANNTQAIDNAMSPLEPQATPGQFSSELELERNRRIMDATVGANNATDAYTNATRSLMPTLTATGRGQEIRSALQDASDAAKQVLEQAWGPINGSTQNVDMDILRATFGNIDNGLSVAEARRFRPGEAGIPDELVNPATPDVPPSPTGILDAKGNMMMRPGEPGQPASGMQPLNEITGIRSALTDAQREAATAGKANEARVIGQYIDAIDGYMANNLPPELQDAYEAARGATRDFNDRFTRPQTAIAQTLKEREGVPAADASTIPSRFVQSDQGKIADFEALMREAGNDTRVQTAVRDQILQDVRDRGLLENPTALTDYLGQYNTVFAKFPALKQELGNAGALRTQMDQAVANADNLTTTLTQQGRSNVANYLSYGDEKAEQAMKGVLASRDPAASIDELLTFVGDEPGAVEGARKVFWDIMQGKSRAGGRTTMDVNGNQPWSPKALSDFLNNPTNAAVAERLYQSNPEHLARIREIADVLQGVDVRNSAKAPNSSGTAQGMQSQLLTPEALQSRAYAYMSGRISGTFLVTSIASVLVRRGVRKAQEQGYQRMMDDILTNADTAALMMKQNNPANRAALAKKAKAWWGDAASTIITDLGNDGEGDETSQAIMRAEAFN